MNPNPNLNKINDEELAQVVEQTARLSFFFCGKSEQLRLQAESIYYALRLEQCNRKQRALYEAEMNNE